MKFRGGSEKNRQSPDFRAPQVGISEYVRHCKRYGFQAIDWDRVNQRVWVLNKTFIFQVTDQLVEDLSLDRGDWELILPKKLAIITTTHLIAKKVSTSEVSGK